MTAIANNSAGLINDCILHGRALKTEGKRNYQLTIDARCMGTGIGTYIVNLLLHLHAREHGLTVRAIINHQDRRRIDFLCDEVFVTDVPIYSLREQWEIPRASKGCDLLHVPLYNVPVFHPGPILVSIHDLIHIMDPSVSHRPASFFYARPMLELAARKASHVVTVSEFSRTQIVERLKIPYSRVTVAYLGVSSKFINHDRISACSEVGSLLSVCQPYLLFVGNLKPHKNLHRLLQAFSLLHRSKRIDHRLLIVGDDRRYKKSVVEESLRLGLEKVVSFLPPVAEELLPKLMTAAETLVMPSTLEGFGLPVIEAMACGTPVVCARAASLPEVAGEAAEYFDPYSVDDMAGAIERVVSSADRRIHLREKGIERIKRFSWEECARRHREVYYSVLDA